MLQVYLVLWFAITGLLTFEYLALHTNPKFSLLLHAQHDGFLSSAVAVTPQAGKTLSLWLGWAGIGLMLVMNLYSLRKRAAFMNGMGSVKAWLDFHIFCGLLGPTCILFHSDFQVRGLVGVSFWCMVVVVVSGVVGRYVYLQLSRANKDMNIVAEKWWTKFENYCSRFAPSVPENAVKSVKKAALRHVGAPLKDSVNPFTAFILAFSGDVRLMLALPATLPGMPHKSRLVLKEFGRSKRKAALVEPLQKLLGYWHAFHSPFAVIMYGSAFIHILTALLFFAK